MRYLVVYKVLCKNSMERNYVINRSGEHLYVDDIKEEISEHESERSIYITILNIIRLDY